MEIQVIDNISNQEQIEAVVMGKNIVIIPTNAVNSLSIIIGYCNEFRSPTHGKRQLIILNEENFYGSILNEFLIEYRRIRPDVPIHEADAHYLVFRKQMNDFFIQTTTSELANVLYPN